MEIFIEPMPQKRFLLLNTFVLNTTFSRTTVENEAASHLLRSTLFCKNRAFSLRGFPRKAFDDAEVDV